MSSVGGPSQRVWYAAYGSNLLEARFLRYLEGGSFPGSTRGHHGARDSTPPAGWRLLQVDRQLCFGHESTRWGGGGVAFLDPAAASGQAWVRCWDVTAEQFADVAAQENGMQPGDLDVDMAAIEAGGTVELTGRWYGAAVLLGRVDDRPVVTFTSPSPPIATVPHETYLSVVGRGLLETLPHRGRS